MEFFTFYFSLLFNLSNFNLGVSPLSVDENHIEDTFISSPLIPLNKTILLSNQFNLLKAKVSHLCRNTNTSSRGCQQPPAPQSKTHSQMPLLRGFAAPGNQTTGPIIEDLKPNYCSIKEFQIFFCNINTVLHAQQILFYHH